MNAKDIRILQNEFREEITKFPNISPQYKQATTLAFNRAVKSADKILRGVRYETFDITVMANIRVLIKDGYTMAEIARKLRTTTATILRNINRTSGGASGEETTKLA